MFEFIVLAVGAAPFLLGFYAFRLIRGGGDSGSDDQPPPPDPDPPLPDLPPTPELRRPRRSTRPSDRGPVAHRPVRRPRRSAT